MKIPKATLERICSTAIESTRYALDHVFLDAKNSRLVATNGHALVRVSVELSEGDVDGLIPVAVMQFARSSHADVIEVGDEYLKVKRSGAPLGTFKKGSGQFPAIASIDSQITIKHKVSATPIAILNFAKIYEIAAAMSIRPADYVDELDINVAIYATGDLADPVVVAPVGTRPDVDSSALSVLMPVKCDAVEIFGAVNKRGESKAVTLEAIDGGKSK